MTEGTVYEGHGIKVTWGKHEGYRLVHDLDDRDVVEARTLAEVEITAILEEAAPEASRVRPLTQALELVRAIETINEETRRKHEEQERDNRERQECEERERREEREELEKRKRHKQQRENRILAMIAIPIDNLITRDSDHDWTAKLPDGTFGSNNLYNDPRMRALKEQVHELVDQRNHKEVAALLYEHRDWLAGLSPAQRECLGDLVQDYPSTVRETIDEKRPEIEAIAKREAWIETHGSDRLKRHVTEGFEYKAIYRDERLACERAGWEWAERVEGKECEPRNAPEEAFALLDQARQNDPNARLVYWTAEHECDDSCEFTQEDCPHYDSARYAALATYMDREIILLAETTSEVEVDGE